MIASSPFSASRFVAASAPLLAFIVALPVLIIVASVFGSGSGGNVGTPLEHRPRRLRRQLARPHAGRGDADPDPGRACRLVYRGLRVSGATAVHLAPAAAPGLPGLHHRLHLYRASRLSRSGTNLHPRRYRVGTRGLLVPADPLSRRRHRHARAGPLPVRVPAGTRGLSRTLGRNARGEPNAGLQRAAELLPPRHPVGAPGDRHRRFAGADGDPRRLRNGSVFRREHLHHRNLPHLLRLRRYHRRVATLGGAAAVRRPVDLHGALFAPQSPLRYERPCPP